MWLYWGQGREGEREAGEERDEGSCLTPVKAVGSARLEVLRSLSPLLRGPTPSRNWLQVEFSCGMGI